MLKKIGFATTTALIAFAVPLPSMAKEAPAVKAEIANPEQLQIAEKIVVRLLPDGTFARIITETMGNLDEIIDSVFGSIGDIFGTKSPDGTSVIPEGEDGEKLSFEEMMTKSDPHFKERMRITTDIVGEEMGKVMAVVEPDIRKAMAQIFARKYTTEQLGEMDRFFSTPTGIAFGRDYFGIGTEKEMITSMVGMVPEMIKGMGALGPKIAEATAHLPPPPKGASDEVTFDDDINVVDLPDCAQDGDTTDCSAEDAAATAAAEAAATAMEDYADESDPYAGETGEEPWYDESNWSAAERKTITDLSNKHYTASEKSSAAYEIWESAYIKAVEASRAKFKAQGWEPEVASNAEEDTSQ